jgi:hypothetical protein
MAAVPEKILWPLVAIIIFAVLLAFYIDDRRRLVAENAMDTNQQQASTQSSSTTNTTKPAANKPSSGQTASQSSSSNQPTNATSMTMDEYLALSSNERSLELEANAAQHQGFSGTIEEYLNGAKPKPTNNMQAKAASNNTTEPPAKAPSASQQQSTNGNAYHGDMNGYLAKFGNGPQTKINKTSKQPFNQQDHMGFHGSYEEYAKKYN